MGLTIEKYVDSSTHGGFAGRRDNVYIWMGTEELEEFWHIYPEQQL
jgi:hypothetical protein